MSPAHEQHPSSPTAKPRAQALKVGAIVALIAAASAGGALYYVRFGDKTSTNYTQIQEATPGLMKIEVPARLWPRLLIRRPDVMTMVVYASKDDESCLAIVGCRPEWAKVRGNRPDALLESVLVEYFPQFETERWASSERREVVVRGAPQPVMIATTRRADDKKECRIVSLANLPTENGPVAAYFQSSVDSSTEDDIDALLTAMH